jgi:hypothetical protein
MIGFTKVTKEDGLLGTLGARLKREHHVVRGEGRAVVELHVLAQLEFPGEVVDRLPRRREAGHELLVGVALDERLEDVQQQRVVGREVVVVRVDRGDRGLQPDRHLALLGACAKARRAR